MKISCIQMDMKLSAPDENFSRAASLIESACADGCDVCVLPETWNTGFFPRDGLIGMSDGAGQRVKEEIGGLAKKYGVNIVAGSVADLREGSVYNTSYIFDRSGDCIASYDKTHLFTPMGEHEYFASGSGFTDFYLDKKRCGILICYDIRFPEAARTLCAEKRLDVLFVVSQWPRVRAAQLETLTKARAVENQMFLALCNSCAAAGDTVYGGGSAIYDPLGNVLARAGEAQEIICADCDMSMLDGIRDSINVFADRRRELYSI